jgi:general secretion pathway protein G
MKVMGSRKRDAIMVQSWTTQLRRVLEARTGRKRGLRAGVTLVEVLIVVAIMAVIAGGATILVFPQFKKSKVQAAKVGAEAVRQAVDLYMTEAEAGECPQVKDLVDSKKLDAKKTDDPWGKPYQVQCSDDGEVHVISFGPNGQEGGEDDIRDDFKPSDIKRVAEK